MIGGSIGLALQSRHPEVQVRVWARRAGSFPAIQALGFASAVSTELEPVVSGAKTVVFCTPIDCMAALAVRVLPWLDADAVVTDAGSVKESVVRELEPVFGAQFVGGHPIAGSDRTGIDAARADLYAGATCVVTPTVITAPDALARVSEFWSAVGCRVIVLSPRDHDAMLSRTSHLPHVVASALAAVVDRAGGDWPSFVGGGYRDTTRIAASNPDLWTGILLANSGDVGRSIAQMQKILQEFAQTLESGDAAVLHRLLSDSRTARLRLNTDLDGI